MSYSVRKNGQGGTNLSLNNTQITLGRAMQRLIDPVAICASAVCAIGKSEVSRRLCSIFEKAVIKALLVFESGYREYFTEELGGGTAYSRFDKAAMARYIMKSLLIEGMSLTVTEFKRGLSRYEALGLGEAPADLYSHCDRIMENFGFGQTEPFVCDTVMGFIRHRAVAAALENACASLGMYMAKAIPDLVSQFHKETMGKFFSQGMAEKGIEYVAKKLRPNIKGASKASASGRQQGDVTAVQVFQAYFHSKAEAVRGLIALSSALFSAEYRLEKYGRLTNSEQRESSVYPSGPLYDVLTGNAKNDEYVTQVLVGMNPTGQELLSYTEGLLAKLFDICIPTSEYLAVKERLKKEGVLDSPVTEHIPQYRNTQEFKKGISVKDYKGFTESANNRFRSRLKKIAAPID